MKTLKILTVLLIGALVCALVSGMLDFKETKNYYADQPISNQLVEEVSDSILVENEGDLQSDKNGYEIGDATADFYLKNVDGSMVSMSDFKSARGFILIFTCNHCPYSVAYEDRIIALDQKYKEQGYPVIAINPNNPAIYPEDSFKKMQERAANKAFTYPYLFDADQRIYPKYGATKTPHVFLLQKENDQTILKYKGAIDDNHQDPSLVKNKFVENAVNALISNQPVAVPTSVAIGCRIQ